MKIAILTLGTRGDVQPFVALGKALTARGHDALLAAPDNFASWVEGHGLRFHRLGIDMQAFLQSQEVRRAMSGNWFALAGIWRRTIVPLLRSQLDATWEAAKDADVIVYHPKASGAVDVAEATGATPVCATPVPLLPTGAFPIIISTRDYGRALNRLTYKAFNLSRAAYLKIINRWRAEVLGLGKGPVFAPIGGFKGGLALRLCAVSPSVVPRPDDWDSGAHMTGYWFLDEGRDWRPDPALEAFLDAGEPPVYIGFGSMTTKNPERLAKEVVEGVRRAGVRAILATGWGGLDEIDVPETALVIEGAPHDVLFQHVSAVVHHGGAGSTAAGLRAGRPTLVCPLTVDQPFWGHRVWTLGCGPRPQPLKRLKADQFAEGLKELVRTESYRIQAASIARSIAREDGVARAIEIVMAATQWSGGPASVTGDPSTRS